MNDCREHLEEVIEHHTTPERKDGCPATWGNCAEGPKLVLFGPPSKTPHVCDGVKRHISKLHRCAKCGRPGHRIAPSRYSKAGRQFRSILERYRKAAAQ